jgi:galactokinase
LQLPPHFVSATENQDWDLIVRSPGRINIIGEHTDYNGGLVLPAAIDKAIYFAVRKRDDRQLIFHALDLDDEATVTLPQSEKTGNLWVDYLLGIADQYRKRGHELPGMDLVFGSDLPRGAGVSSSAALEGGMAFICNEIIGAGLSRPELAQLCKASSNNFMGIPSGIMDQFASLNGVKDRAILLDCDTLDFELVKAELPGYEFLLVNSMVTHELASSEYPVRVAECQEALAVLQQYEPELKALCHASPAAVEAVKGKMREVVYRRARFATTEMNRIRQAVVSLQAGDAVAVGKEMNATHAGLRDDYEVSCEEVDLLQSFAENYAGVAGSRIMGGGFGGCTINLIKVDRVAEFTKDIAAAYHTAIGKEPCFYEVPLSTGTEIIG